MRTKYIGKEKISESEIRAIRIACMEAIYGEGNMYREVAASRGLTLLSELLGAFPSKLFKVCPELEDLYQKLENGEVKLSDV